jgi:uncharacterized protein
MHTHTNDLIHESSPYLLQHAHNPVDWHAWNIDNLSEAKHLDKPILISIGYSSCHWCHVMEHESFENDAIAAYMNENFYCIKVDREERPDVDQIYMTAAHIISGNGGWPLNCFALPDSKPFHAGTYYPAAGWLKLLQTVHDQYQQHREKLNDYATRLTKGIRLQETAISDNPTEKLDAKEIVKTVENWKTSWDMTEGGMNGAPKFPMPSNLHFLMDYTHQFTDTYTDSFIQLTLEKMAYGGIFDQLAGGFSRYSVDALWKAPHFEKMLYDNAQLLTIYAKAYKKYNDPLYLEILTKTTEWLVHEMRDASGLFYAALDADSEGEEGKFYVWKTKEVLELLGEDYELARIYYQVDGKGMWEHGNNILLRNHHPSEIAQQLDITEENLAQRIGQINEKLLADRSTRVRPGLDDKCLTAWNALLATGLAETYKATGNADYKIRALTCIDALLQLQVQANQIWHTYKAGNSTINGMLDDYAFTAEACIAAFEISGDEYYLNAADMIIQRAIHTFYDVEKELFYFNEQNELIVRTTEVNDNVIPSTNSAMAHVLHSIGVINGNTYYLELAENLIGKVQSNISTYPSGHSNWARAQLKYTMPYFELAIVGTDAEKIAQQLQSKNLPNTLILFSVAPSNLPIFANRWVNDKTLIYVCRLGMCQLPVEHLSEALALLKV